MNYIQYFGGKSRIANEVVNILEHIRQDNQTYIEPFVGGASIVSKMSGERHAYDKHPYLIAMYRALQNGWIPPTTVTEEEYRKAKEGELPDYLTGFIGFGCSFSGKWFGGYARNKRERNYCMDAHNSILRKMQTLQDVTFDTYDYRQLNLKDALVYCDPPYKGTTQYGKIVGEFDSNEFWDNMRNWSQNNMVVISEYNAPDDFIEIWSKQTRTDIRNKENKLDPRVEKLFVHNSLKDAV